MGSCRSDPMTVGISPRRGSLRRKAVQMGSASEVPISIPRTSRRPSLLTPVAMMAATETTRPPRRQAVLVLLKQINLRWSVCLFKRPPS
jgi:hypothetical protein